MRRTRLREFRSDLSDPRQRFKVDRNAKQHSLTGCVVCVSPGSAFVEAAMRLRAGKKGGGLAAAQGGAPGSLGATLPKWDGMAVVIVEGGKKAIKAYSKLMLRRIKWNDRVIVEDEDDGNEGNGDGDGDGDGDEGSGSDANKSGKDGAAAQFVPTAAELDNKCELVWCTYWHG